MFFLLALPDQQLTPPNTHPTPTQPTTQHAHTTATKPATMKGALQLLAVSAAAALGGVHAFIPSLPSSTPAPAVAGPKGKQVHVPWRGK